MNVKDVVLEALDLFFSKIKGIFVQKAEIVDNCASTATTYPLSANQGYQLQKQVTSIKESLHTLTDISTGETYTLYVENGMFCIDDGKE
jgi:hypothetical protein